MGFWDKLPHGVVGKGVADKKEDAVPNTSLGEKGGFYSPNTLLKQNALNDYMKRDPLEYNFNDDPVYQQLKDKYIQQGKMAMMDTMGQAAAAMTGGYGNSYAQSVGQQAYAAQLQNLNDVVPELYQMALDNYNREGEEMLNKYALYSAEEQNDYDRWWNERQWEQQYGEKQTEKKSPYPEWYNEGGAFSSSSGETVNKADINNLDEYLKLQGYTGTTPEEYVDFITKLTGEQSYEKALDIALQRMNREVKYYATTDLATVEAKAKTFTNNEALEAYLDGEMARGLSEDDAMRIYKMYKQPDTTD